MSFCSYPITRNPLGKQPMNEKVLRKCLHKMLIKVSSGPYNVRKTLVLYIESEFIWTKDSLDVFRINYLTIYNSYMHSVSLHYRRRPKNLNEITMQ